MKTKKSSDNEESKLESLKKEYAKIQKKHGLPSFEILNEEFQIERIAEIETEILIREIRKFMADKFSNYMRMIETILNPVSSPMFIFSVIKSIGMKEKEKLTDIYKKLAGMEIELIEVDIKFSEEREAKFIKDYCKVWESIKKDLLDVVDVIKKNWDNKTGLGDKGYIG